MSDWLSLGPQPVAAISVRGNPASYWREFTMGTNGKSPVELAPFYGRKSHEVYQDLLVEALGQDRHLAIPTRLRANRGRKSS